MIIRGTTPYHSFILPALVANISKIYISYCQNEDVIFEREYPNVQDSNITLSNLLDLYENASMGEDLDIEYTEEYLNSCQLTVHLSQEDTLKFHFYPAAEKNIAVIQIRLLTSDGEAYASDPIHERIFGVLKDGVI